MSRSRARKNRFKYKTLRKLGFFKVFAIAYPDYNGRVYPDLNFGSTKFSKEFIREVKHRQGGVFSIASQVDEGYSNMWDTGLNHAQEAVANGEQFYPTMEPQTTSHMECHLDVMCVGMGVSRENLVINAPVSLASSVEEKVKAAIKTEHEIKRERFRGPDISKLHGDDDLNWAISPWPTKMNLAGVWSQPVDASNLQGPSFEIVKIEAMVQKAKHQLCENRRERIIEAAKIIGETIEVDTFLLGDNLKVFRQREDMWNMEAVEIDTPEWVIVMMALCRVPEAIEHLKGKGFTPIHVISSSLISITEVKYNTDIYYIYDNLNDKDIESFKPTSFSEKYWNSMEQKPLNILKIDEQLGESIKRFNTEEVTMRPVDWNLLNDK